MDVRTYVGRLFQWKGGPKEGQYERAESEDQYTVKFESGESLSKSEIPSMMVEHAIPGDEPFRPMDAVGAPAPYIDPAILGNPPPPAAPPPEEAVIESIISKQKRMATLTVELPIEVPPREVRALLSSMYEDDMVGRIIGARSLDALRKSLESDRVLDAVALAIHRYYNTNDEDAADPSAEEGV